MSAHLHISSSSELAHHQVTVFEKKIRVEPSHQFSNDALSRGRVIDLMIGLTAIFNIKVNESYFGIMLVP